MRNATFVLSILSIAAGTNGYCDASADDTPQAACAALMIRVAALGGLPESGPPGLGWSCDTSRSQVDGYYVIALRSRRPAPYSNLMGWYAVERHTHAVYEYDVANMKIGLPLAQPQH